MVQYRCIMTQLQASIISNLKAIQMKKILEVATAITVFTYVLSSVCGKSFNPFQWENEIRYLFAGCTLAIVVVVCGTMAMQMGTKEDERRKKNR